MLDQHRFGFAVATAQCVDPQQVATDVLGDVLAIGAYGMLFR